MAAECPLLDSSTGQKIIVHNYWNPSKLSNEFLSYMGAVSQPLGVVTKLKKNKIKWPFHLAYDF